MNRIVIEILLWTSLFGSMHIHEQFKLHKIPTEPKPIVCCPKF